MSDDRTQLIAAASRLALTGTVNDLDVDHLCAEAHVERAAFDTEFPDIDEYLCAVQQDFLERQRDKMLAITAGAGPGLPRLQMAVDTFLGGCLDERPLRRWLIDARERPLVAAVLRRLMGVFWIMIASELQAMGWKHPQAGARLIQSMANEISIIENERGHSMPAYRASLWHFIQIAGGP